MSDESIGLTAPPAGYSDWLSDLKGRIHTAQQRATLAVNRELVLLYWNIGHDILSRQSEQGWGSKVIDRLAQDLRAAFPDMKGFSPRNLKYMRAFAEAWPDSEFVQGVLAQLPWYHQVALLDKLPGPETRRWYIAQAIENNWSRNTLDAQLKHPQDGPTIGLLLCKSKNEVVAEYALRDNNRPIGVAQYQLVETLPPELKTRLPSIEQIERELAYAAL